MSNPLIPILIRLSEGKSVTVEFPSASAMEAFRQAIYREKKDFDAGMFSVIPDYEIMRLQFRLVTAPPVYKVSMVLYKAEKKQLQFTIVSDDNSES